MPILGSIQCPRESILILPHLFLPQRSPSCPSLRALAYGIVRVRDVTMASSDLQTLFALVTWAFLAVILYWPAPQVSLASSRPRWHIPCCKTSLDSSAIIHYIAQTAFLFILRVFRRVESQFAVMLTFLLDCAVAG